ncbi:MAG: prealbumin-like fold domain-containing protein [Muribaculaceae bacterium]|nr:prealbumin-like fold domain-containing protein [Muribaculaceae bacterium]
MKFRYIAAAAVMACASLASQAAKTPSELRVYINPGHGSWTGNDRPMQVIGKPAYSSTNTDTTGFFESNTDLIKGFGMLEKLIEMGMPFDRTLNQTGERWEIGAARDLSQNIVMSRVKNGPFEDNNTTSSPNYMQYNRNLLEIATEVEHNEFDIFVSIHSNAATVGSTVNYHLFMYRGHNGKDGVLAPGSYEMAEAAAKYSFINEHAAWSANYPYINGDIDFMTSDKKGTYNDLGYYGYLGVLKHGTPGYLVEGYFHTYLPATHRGMNFDVDAVEGMQYARGVAEYFEFEKRDATGEIYGIVRDRHERFAHQLYKPNPATDDIYKPLNGVKAVLMQDGEKVAEYTTDEFYNGAFVFTGLKPGKYTVEVEHPDYKSADPLEVEVKAGATSYPKMFIEAADYVEPDNVASNYPDPAVKYGALSATDNYEVATLIEDAEIPALDGLTVRRVIARDGRLYILALDKPIEYAAAIPVDEQAKATILVYDIKKQEVVATVSTEGAAGSIAPISDIQLAADGVLLACNATKNQYDASNVQEGDAGRGTFHIYKWENDKDGLPAGDPESWISTTYSGLWYRAYPTRFVYSGTTQEGKFVIPMPTITGPAYSTRAVAGTVLDGNPQVVDGIKPSVAYNTGDAGADLNLFASPLSEDEALVIDSKNAIGSWNFNTPYEFIEKGNDLLKGVSGASSLMRYAGHSYVVKALADGTLELVDITDGLAKAVATGITFQAAPVAGEVASVATAAETLADRDVITGAVTDAWFNLYLLRDGHLSAYTTKGQAKADRCAPMAYDLNQNLIYTVNEKSLSFRFKVTADAPSATLVFTNSENSADVLEVEVGPVKAGELYDIDSEPFLKDVLDMGLCNWAVKVEGYPVNVAGTYYTDPEAKRTAGSRGGVVAFTDTENPETVGMVAVSHSYAAGFDVFGGDGAKLASNVHSGAPFVTTKINSAIRGGEFCGRAVFIDWSDANAGIYALDPLKANDPIVQMFAGTRDGIGAYTYEGKVIGGGGSGVSFQRKGDDFYMYTFEEDLGLVANNGDNLLVRYTIPADEYTIKVGPDEEFDRQYSGKNLLTSTNVDIDAFPGGFIASQLSGENSEAKPGFIIADESGKQLFNSSALTDMLTCSSGVALSKDRKTIAAPTKAGVQIYAVDWAEDGTPSLTFKYQIPGTASEWCDLAFDLAGNLHAYTLEKGYACYALTNPAPVTVTPAASKDFVHGIPVGIAGVEADGDAPVEFFNLQGIRVAADALTPGIYIRRQGNTASKVVVR